MGFETKTEIQTAVGGEAKVRNIVKRPLFLPDDKVASNSYGHGGICVTCGRMTDCPICDVEPGGDPDGNQQCLSNWTLFVSGGSGAGPNPDYGEGGSRRMTVTVNVGKGAQFLSGRYGVTRTWLSQPMFWPKQSNVRPGPLTSTSIQTGSSSVEIIFGQAEYYSSPFRTSRKHFTSKLQFEGWGVTVILRRIWSSDRRNICVDRPYNPNIQWPYMDAWKYPCTWPPQHMDQWLYAVSRNDYPTDLRACYKSTSSYRFTCETWGEKQVLIYHAAVSADGLAKKLRCQDFAGIEPGLVAQSDESWNGPYRRTKSVFDYTQERKPGGLHPRMDAPYPLDFWKWEGTPPSVVIFPSENEIFKPASPQSSRSGMTGTGTVT